MRAKMIICERFVSHGSATVDMFHAGFTGFTTDEYPTHHPVCAIVFIRCGADDEGPHVARFNFIDADGIRIGEDLRVEFSIAPGEKMHRIQVSGVAQFTAPGDYAVMLWIDDAEADSWPLRAS